MIRNQVIVGYVTATPEKDRPQFVSFHRQFSEPLVNMDIQAVKDLHYLTGRIIREVDSKI